MPNKIQKFLESEVKKELPNIKPGQQIKVTQRIKEGAKERLYSFQGQVLARKHGKEAGASITIRRIASGVGTEVVLPLHSPFIEKIEILRQDKVRQAKLYYLRTAKGKRAKLKKV